MSLKIMRMMHEFARNPVLRNLLFVLLVLGAASGLGYLAAKHHLQRDVTYNSINSLDPDSIAVLRQLDGPVRITVYATEQDARLGDIRKIIAQFPVAVPALQARHQSWYSSTRRRRPKRRAPHRCVSTAKW